MAGGKRKPSPPPNRSGKRKPSPPPSGSGAASASASTPTKKKMIKPPMANMLHSMTPEIYGELLLKYSQPMPDPNVPSTSSAHAGLPGPNMPSTSFAHAALPDPNMPSTSFAHAALPDPNMPSTSSAHAALPDPDEPSTSSAHARFFRSTSSVRSSQNGTPTRSQRMNPTRRPSSSSSEVRSRLSQRSPSSGSSRGSSSSFGMLFLNSPRLTDLPKFKKKKKAEDNDSTREEKIGNEERAGSSTGDSYNGESPSAASVTPNTLSSEIGATTQARMPQESSGHGHRTTAGPRTPVGPRTPPEPYPENLTPSPGTSPVQQHQDQEAVQRNPSPPPYEVYEDVSPENLFDDDDDDEAEAEAEAEVEVEVKVKVEVARGGSRCGSRSTMNSSISMDTSLSLDSQASESSPMILAKHTPYFKALEQRVLAEERARRERETNAERPESRSRSEADDDVFEFERQPQSTSSDGSLESRPGVANRNYSDRQKRRFKPNDLCSEKAKREREADAEPGMLHSTNPDIYGSLLVQYSQPMSSTSSPEVVRSNNMIQSSQNGTSTSSPYRRMNTSRLSSSSQVRTRFSQKSPSSGSCRGPNRLDTLFPNTCSERLPAIPNIKMAEENNTAVAREEKNGDEERAGSSTGSRVSDNSVDECPSAVSMTPENEAEAIPEMAHDSSGPGPRTPPEPHPENLTPSPDDAPLQKRQDREAVHRNPSPPPDEVYEEISPVAEEGASRCSSRATMNTEDSSVSMESQASESPPVILAKHTPYFKALEQRVLAEERARREREANAERPESRSRSEADDEVFERQPQSTSSDGSLESRPGVGNRNYSDRQKRHSKPNDLCSESSSKSSTSSSSWNSTVKEAEKKKHVARIRTRWSSPAKSVV